MKRLAPFLTMMIILMLLASRCTKQDSIGKMNKIVVIADSLLWEDIEPLVQSKAAPEIRTPQPETMFNLLHRSADRLNKLTRVPNLLIIGTLQDSAYMESLLDQVLTPQSRQRIEADSAFLFAKEDPWALNQMLVMAVAKDTAALKESLRQKGEEIYQLFDQSVNERIYEQVYRFGAKSELSREWRREYGWSIRTPSTFDVIVDSSEINFMFMRRPEPQRWFSVHWEQADGLEDLTEDWMRDQRRWIGADMYDGDYVYESKDIGVTFREVYFADRPAIRMSGVWQNDKHIMGGPFISYGFWNESDGRLYFIDLAVYAPGERKAVYLRQLEAMASTFKTANE